MESRSAVRPTCSPGEVGTDIELEWNVLNSGLFLVQFKAHMDDKETTKGYGGTSPAGYSPVAPQFADDHC